MIQHQFTREAETAAGHYALMTEALRGVYARAIDSRDFGTPAGISRAEEDAYQIAHVFSRQVLSTTEFVLAGVVREAHTATLREFASIASDKRTDEANELLSESVSYLQRELYTQIERDIQTVVGALRRVSREIGQAARVRGISRRSAIIEHKVSNHSDVSFLFHDRAARKYQSRTFVRSLFRHTMLNLYNEVVLSTIADHGQPTAIIDHVNPESSFHGLEIALHSAGELPAYSEIREEVFHPNSDAILKAKVA